MPALLTHVSTAAGRGGGRGMAEFSRGGLGSNLLASLEP